MTDYRAYSMTYRLVLFCAAGKINLTILSPMSSTGWKTSLEQAIAVEVILIKVMIVNSNLY